MARRPADPQLGRVRQSAHPDTIRLTHHAAASPGFLSDRLPGPHERFLRECFPILWRTLTSVSSCFLRGFFPPFYHFSISFIGQQSLVVIGLAIIGFLVFLLLDKPASTNVINLIQIISWPIVILITLLLLHRPLSRFIESLGGPNVQPFKVSVLQFGLELSKASASKFTPHWADTSNDLDLRLTAADELISNIPSLFDQFKDTTSLDYALIDIGNGDKWLTSRLFIFAIML